MPNEVQIFLATAAVKAASNLEEALQRVPEDKRGWSAMGDARTALDMVAECALLNDNTADLITRREFKSNLEQYLVDKADLAHDEARAIALLHESAAEVAEAIRTIPDADMAVTIEMPWGPMKLEDIAAYPQWNMSYHEGQTNYIASLLGCLK